VLALRIAFALALALSAATAHTAERFDTVKLATWNLEWLISPAAFKSLKGQCAPKGAQLASNERVIPCDVAQRKERSSRDFRELSKYAQRLDADVIALQEVDGAEAARLVFAGYEFCFSGSHHVQNVGFAIRPGLPKRCAPDITELSLRDSLRRGVELVLFPGEAREIHLLSIHLKSGCSSQPLDSGEKPCNTLARQVPFLKHWVDAQSAANRRFAVLGDFNRTLLTEVGPARSMSGRLQQLWPALEGAQSSPGRILVNAAAGQAFHNCVPGQAHATYIDHIVLSGSLAALQVPGSFQRVTFSAADARHARLSDHCPVSVTLDMRQIPGERRH
jgi:endonuclease/exonuclease/phosphatase family metal-dependent hydrolase